MVAIMVDPISDEEEKRGRRIKYYQQYQDHLDEMNKDEKKDSISSSSGYLQGKKIKKLTSDESLPTNLFPNSTGNKNL